jgi:hypothetical protein
LSHASRPSPITSAISSAASRMSATRWSSRRLTGRQTPPGWRGRGFSGHRPRRRQRSGRAAPPTRATSASGRTGSCLDRSRPAGRCRCLACPHRALPSRKGGPSSRDGGPRSPSPARAWTQQACAVARTPGQPTSPPHG